ncbi:MAG TPA: hypothetical protein DDY91_14795 [Planctomycetaceae bacterium]|nr:hypothetical protein [Planctomycetaceae bacterium]
MASRRRRRSNPRAAGRRGRGPLGRPGRPGPPLPGPPLPDPPPLPGPAFPDPDLPAGRWGRMGRRSPRSGGGSVGGIPQFSAGVGQGVNDQRGNRTGIAVARVVAGLICSPHCFLPVSPGGPGARED